jgi:hypothetical protein
LRLARCCFLGVDDHVLVVRQADQHVRTFEIALFRAPAFLQEVFVVGAQSRLLQNPFQHQFAPVALDLGIAFQRLGEIFRLFIDLLGGLLEIFHLGEQRCPILAFRVVDLLHPLTEIDDLVLEGIEHGG